MSRYIISFFLLISSVSLSVSLQGKTVEERREAALAGLAKQGGNSIEALQAYFRAKFGSDITQSYSYKHIKESLFRTMQSSSEVARALACITTGPFALVLAKEVELDKAGYYVYYHGQSSCWGFQEDFTTALINELARCGKTEPLRDDFLYIQNVPNMLGGRPGSPPQSELWVNTVLLGNTFNSSCRTWEYALQNYNMSAHNLNLDQDIFWSFNMLQLSDQYRSRIEKLYKQLESIRQGGRLLQVAIPKDDTWTQWTHCQNNYDKYNGNDSTATTLPMGSDYLLNPNSSVKIYAYDAQAPSNTKKYQQWLTDRDKLITELVNDMIAQNLI